MSDPLIRWLIIALIIIIAVYTVDEIYSRQKSRVLKVSWKINRHLRIKWYIPQNVELRVLISLLAKGMEANRNEVLNTDFLDELDKLCAHWHDHRRAYGITAKEEQTCPESQDSHTT